MATWNEYLRSEGKPPSWPYPIKFGEEQVVDTDVLVVGGGIAGCWAAIAAARTGVKVALLEKGDVKRSGSGGPGCDHWCNAPANPLSRVDPDEWAVHMADRPYCNGIGIQIQCREDYDTLLEMEQMGGKIRDTNDDYVGAEGRDDATKFMISPRYGTHHSYAPDPHMGEPGFNPPEKRNNVVIRIWGNTFKPALKKECQRLGVQVFDRIMGTSLLNDGGVQGARVVGATGLNSRTGEFMIFRAKSVIIATSGAGSVWLMSMEHGGYSNMHSRAQSGDGTAMAWKAGAALTMMEASSVIGIATGLKHKWYSGAGDASYENVPIVDAKGRRLPYPIQGWEDAGAMMPTFEVQDKIRDAVLKGEYELPFYGDWPAMAEVERRATWNLMLMEESTTRVMVNAMNKSGFDINRDQQLSYKFIEGNSPAQWRDSGYGGGVVVDWDLKSTVDGLYAAGTQMFAPEDHSYAAATGRYAGRKAAAYAQGVGEGKVSREQIDKEKERVLAPTKRDTGIEWKELHSGLSRAMQYFVSEFKTEHLLKMGLEEVERIEAEAVPQLFAHDPHKLMRSLEDLSMIEYAKIHINASLARKASSRMMGFSRIDYPELDPAEWHKYLTIKQENGKIVTGDMPQAFWGDMKKSYEAHNKDYTGVYNPNK
ncbi:MAG: FAD-dependent oxidoreductase [Oscillospiraceae bacterium]|nr:FAD-dependent oxidoreductase [Oscillospiraceae bacterium]